MADSSLIDFQGAAQMAMGLGQLEQTQRHNDILEGNSQLQKDSLAFQQQKQKQDVMGKAYDEITKFQSSPFYAGLQPDRKIQLAYSKGTLLEGLAGQKVGLPSKEEMAGSYEEINTLMDTMRNGTPQDRQVAFDRAMVAAPEWASGLFKEMKTAGELSTQMEERNLKLEQGKAQLQSWNLKNARANLQQNFFSEHVAGLGRTMALVNDPRFAQDFRKVQSFENPEAKQIYLQMHPEFRTAFEKELQQEGLQLPMMGLALGEEVRSRTDAVRDAQARTGEVPAELEEELSGYEAVRKARALQAEFLADPFNKDKFRAIQKAHQDIRILNGAAGKKLEDISKNREQFLLSQSKFDQKTQSGLAESTLQEHYLAGLNSGQDDNQALGSAIKKVRDQYPGVPFDATKVMNPSKKGKLELGITNTTKAGLEQDVLNQNLTQQTIDDIRQVVSQNPTAVGAVGNMKRFFGGIGQQVMDVAKSNYVNDARIDKDARERLGKMFDTKSEDELHALTTGLTYRVARQLSGAGNLSDKDITQAEKLVGGLRNASGSQQFLNHLGIIERESRRRAKQASTALDTKTLPDTASGGGDVPSTAEDYLKMLGIGSQ